MKIRNVFDFIINKLPIINLIDGYKTTIAAAIVAFVGAAKAIAPILPPDQAEYILKIADEALKVAEVLAGWGLIGKGVKTKK